MGEWIEIASIKAVVNLTGVSPFMGEWIEIIIVAWSALST